MSKAISSGCASGEVHHEAGGTVPRDTVHWLSLAAAPTFAFMAFATGGLHGGPPEMLCSAALGASPLSGMVLMYLLMSLFHLAPWLKLISHSSLP